MKKTDTITVSLALQDNGPAVKERREQKDDGPRDALPGPMSC